MKDIPLPFSESQLPGFLTTGRLDFTSGFSLGDVTSSRDSNRSPSGLLSRFCEGAGAGVSALACARMFEEDTGQRTLATRAVWRHVDVLIGPGLGS